MESADDDAVQAAADQNAERWRKTLNLLGSEARIHHSTLTRLSQGELERLPQAERKRAQRIIQSESYRLKMHPELWRVALDLADNNRFRIEVLSETEVIVHNNEDWA